MPEAEGNLTCPRCGSHDVECTSTRKEHSHRCYACGHSMITAPSPPWT